MCELYKESLIRCGERWECAKSDSGDGGDGVTVVRGEKEEEEKMEEEGKEEKVVNIGNVVGTGFVLELSSGENVSCSLPPLHDHMTSEPLPLHTYMYKKNVV